MPLKISLSLVIITLLIGNFFATLSPASAEPQAISCPSGRTIWLDGTSPPGESLLIFLAERAVGGGSARSDGRWRLPLRVNERPGSYLVEVRSRASSAVYAQYTCFIDQPIDGFSPTPTGTTVEGSSPTAGRASPTVGSNVPTTTAAVTRTPTASSQAGRPTSTPSSTQAPGGGSTSEAGSTSTVTPTPTRTTGTAPGVSTSTATPTQTRTQGPSPTIEANKDITILEIFIGEGDGSEENPDLGYAEIQNSGTIDVNMRGWQLVNVTFANLTYTFPDIVLPAPSSNGSETAIELFLEAIPPGEITDPDELTLYWGLTYRPWRVGDQVELRDANGRRISSFAVTAP